VLIISTANSPKSQTKDGDMSRHILAIKSTTYECGPKCNRGRGEKRAKAEETQAKGLYRLACNQSSFNFNEN